MSLSSDTKAKQALNSIKVFSATDVGRCREENQDTIGIIETDRFKFFLVADGMGGVKGGSIASRLAIDVVTNALDEELDLSYKNLVTAVSHANAMIFEKSMDDSSLTGMGTTLVGLAFIDTRLWLVNVGDSRVYRIRDAGIQQLTTDHTLISELLKSGAITPDQVSNHPVSHMLTRSLGPTSTVEIDCALSRSGPIAKDIYVLCSDGLYNLVSDQEIASIIADQGVGDDALQTMIKLANQRGGTDNISIVLVEVGDNFPVTSIDELDGDEDPMHSQTLELDPAADSTLEMLDNPFTGSNKAHKENLLKRYKEIYEIASSSYPPVADRRYFKIRFVGTLIALFLVMAGSYRLGFLFAGNSTSRVVANSEAARRLSDSEIPHTKQLIDTAISDSVAFMSESELDRNDFGLKERLKDIETQVVKLDQFLALFDVNDSLRTQQLVDQNRQEYALLKQELGRVRSKIDVATRELAVWYGRRQRMETVDALRLAKELAVGSLKVKELQTKFEETTWGYLNMAERLRYNPDDQDLRSKVYQLKKERLELRSQLTELIQAEVDQRVRQVDKRVAELTLRRDDVEAQITMLDQDKLVLNQILKGSSESRDIVYKTLTDKRRAILVEKSELESLVVSR